MAYIVLGFTILYAIGVWLLYRGWLYTPFFVPSEEAPLISASVIIPVRNEAKNIYSLLTDLFLQTYPKSHFEVILVNDNSEDNTLAEIKNFQDSYPTADWLRIIDMKATLIGKKKALHQGIQVAKGVLILTTDGDTRIGQNWLSTVVSFYQQKQAKFISSPVALDFAQNFFEKIQVVEFASLVGTGAGTLHWGKPTMCNGANIAFEKAVFEEVGGYEGNWHIASGDDEFLMQKIFGQYPNRVFFLKNKEAIVRTAPSPSWKVFFHQRKRWASKWKAHQSITVRAVALFVFFYHLLNIFSFFLLITDYVLILIHILLKFSIEFIFLRQVHSFLNKNKYSFYFLPLFVIYSFYAVYIGIMANFKGYKWKNRKLA
jgi:cellulose synthase/poly-beta-1,6-N-acetylglucosamine synthase-like glycosyltransferase